MNAADELKLRKWLDSGHNSFTTGPTGDPFCGRVEVSAESQIDRLVGSVSEWLGKTSYSDVGPLLDILSLFPLLLARVRELETK